MHHPVQIRLLCVLSASLGPQRGAVTLETFLLLGLVGRRPFCGKAVSFPPQLLVSVSWLGTCTPVSTRAFSPTRISCVFRRIFSGDRTIPGALVSAGPGPFAACEESPHTFPREQARPNLGLQASVGGSPTCAQEERALP